MYKPVILNEGDFSENDLENLRQTRDVFKVVDIYEYQLRELFKILHPSSALDDTKLNSFIKEHSLAKTAGAWIYYPWSGILMHVLGKENLFKLKTNRNQLLITNQEQQKLKDTVVGVAGMSVGAGMAISLAYSGASETIKIADFDELDTSNLNRLREPMSSVGMKKVELATQHIYEINPFADVHAFENGIDKNNIQQFFSNPEVNIIIDEIDDFKMKVELRIQAKKLGVPVLMFSSLGDNILVDIERFDIDPELQIFHGLFGELTNEIINNSNITKEDENRYAVLLVGKDYVPTRALATLLQIGNKLVGRPQLYSTISVDSGLAAYLVRRITLGEKLKSGRFFIKFAELFDQESSDLSSNDERDEIINELLG